MNIDQYAEKVAMLIYQYDFPKDRDLPPEHLRYKAMERYCKYPLTQRIVRDLVALHTSELGAELTPSTLPVNLVIEPADTHPDVGTMTQK